MKRAHKEVVLPSWRFWFIIFFILTGFAALIWRLVDLTIFNRTFLVKQGQMRTVRDMDIPAYRGMIMDRNGVPLAISTPVDSIWVNPSQFHPTSHELAQLAHLLQMKPRQIQRQIDASSSHSFVYLKRANPVVISQQISQLKIEGLFFQREYKRSYPEGEVTAHLLGMTNVDDHGQEGLEMAYDQWLAGKPGKKQVIKDRLGNIISELALLQKPQQGQPLVLSIDQRIQYSAYQALKAAVQEYQAESGSIVVLDSRTNEVLAMVNQPSFDPNNRPPQHDGRFRNRAVTDMFEPGSTIKPFTIALALQSGKFLPTSMVDTNPGWIMVGGYRITDEEKNNGVISLTQLLAKSSNIGATKIMMSLPPDAHWNLLHQSGFGELTDSHFPGEASGRLPRHSTWRPSVVATMAYGYGISVTALQLAHAYTVFAEEGILRPLSLIKIPQAGAGKKVISNAVSHHLLTMLENVVQEGTGKRAQIPGYRVGGKTGTAYIAGPNGYDRHRYISSFVGIAPLNNPRLVIAVVVREPHGQHLGALVSAPVFSKVMSDSLRILNVKPDQVIPLNSNS